MTAMPPAPAGAAFAKGQTLQRPSAVVRPPGVRRRRRGRSAPYAFIAPFFVVFGVFGLFPLVYTAYVSLTGWRADRPGSEDTVVGLSNYGALLHDEFFWNALKNTLGIGVLATVPQLLIALGVAHLLNYRIRGRTLFRMGVLLPNITSVAAVTIIFTQLFGRDYGLVNWLLGHRIEWQAGTLSSWSAIAIIVTWRWTGYNALIYLASMQAIPYELYESAALDGASRWRQFWSVTVPLLRPTILFTVVVSTIGNLQLFGEPLLFSNNQVPTAGGSQHQFQTLAVYTYDQFWQKFKYGYGASISWALFLVIVVMVGVVLALTRRLRGVDES